MRSLRSLLKLKKPKLVVRRVVGDSMLPTLKGGQLIIASNLKKYHPGSLVVIHHGGIDKVKRLKEIRKNQLFVVGDNGAKSTDSRYFGWVSSNSYIATVIWPIYQQKK